MAIFRIRRDSLSFPNPRLAEREPNGLLGVGGDLSAERLLAAYRIGIFPWYSAGQPILWWSPDPRMVLAPRELHVPRRMGAVLRRCAIGRAGPGRFSDPGRPAPGSGGPAGFRLTLDEAFGQVIAACARAVRPGQGGTWITPEMIAAYARLHELGHAHSCEAWAGGRLAGGVYGVAVGRCFAAESMFYRRPDAGKAALVALVPQLAAWGFALIDCQVHTDNAARFGAREIPRDRYLTELADAAARAPRLGRWRFDDDFDPRPADPPRPPPVHSNARHRSGGQ